MNDAQMDRRSFLVGGLTLVAAGSGRLLAGLGANYLLNVGPDPLGRIPVPCIDILKAVGAGAREGAEG